MTIFSFHRARVLAQPIWTAAIPPRCPLTCPHRHTAAELADATQGMAGDMAEIDDTEGSPHQNGARGPAEGTSPLPVTAGLRGRLARIEDNPVWAALALAGLFALAGLALWVTP